MPRYWFAIVDAGDPTRDPHGVDLADDDEARDQAIGLLQEMMRFELPNGDRHEVVIKVRNERDQIVYEASLALDGRWWPGRR